MAFSQSHQVAEQDSVAQQETGILNTSLYKKGLFQTGAPLSTITEVDPEVATHLSRTTIDVDDTMVSNEQAATNAPSPEEEQIDSWTFLKAEEGSDSDDVVPSASVPAVLERPVSASSQENTLVNSDEEYGSSSKSFVDLDGQHRTLPQDRNGTSSYDSATGLYAPLLAAAQLENLHPSNLKRTLSEVTDAVGDKLSVRINDATRGMDVPAMADNVIGPIFRVPERFSALQRAGRRKYREFDNMSAPRMFSNKRHASDQEEPDYDALEQADARGIFARKMAGLARKAMVVQGICYIHQVVMCQRLHYDLELALGKFYTEWKPRMTAKELMRADVCWFAGENCFELELEASWPVSDEEETNLTNIHWEPIKFHIPDLNKYCKVSAADYISRNVADVGNTNVNVTVAEDQAASGHSTNGNTANGNDSDANSNFNDHGASSQITSDSATDISILEFDLSDTNTEISEMDANEIDIKEDVDSDDAGDCMVEGFVLTWS